MSWALVVAGTLSDYRDAERAPTDLAAGLYAFLREAMIYTIVVVILALLLVTKLGGLAESLITLGFLAFFFLYLLRLLNVIDTPFKVGQERTDDDVSLFLLTEFVVHAQAAGTAAVVPPEGDRRGISPTRVAAESPATCVPHQTDNPVLTG